MAKQNSKNKGPWIIGSLLLIGGYIWQKKIVISNVDGEMPVYATDDFLGTDKPIKQLQITKGEKVGRLVRTFNPPDYPGKKYIVQTPEGYFGFIDQTTFDDKDLKLGYV